MIEFYSHEQQDEFVFNIFNHKTGGYFLDIAAGHPWIGSNTYTLEKQFGWQGLCFDVYDYEQNFQWSQHRSAPFVLMDVCTDQFTDFIKNTVPSRLVVDYVSLDVNGPNVDMVLIALKKLINSGIRFKSVTFEHECWLGDGNETNRIESRKILEGLGLVRLFEDVKLWGLQFSRTGNYSFEDWWIDPLHFDYRLLLAKRSNLFYNEAIEVLKENRSNTYLAKHMCSRAHQEEYCTFWNPGERQEVLNFFEQIKSH